MTLYAAMQWYFPGKLPRVCKVTDTWQLAQFFNCSKAAEVNKSLRKLRTKKSKFWKQIMLFHVTHHGIIESVGMSLSKLWEIVKDREAWRATVPGVTKSQTWLSDWTTTHYTKESFFLKRKAWHKFTSVYANYEMCVCTHIHCVLQETVLVYVYSLGLIIKVPCSMHTHICICVCVCVC